MIGDKIRELRKSIDMSQAKLGQELGVTQQAVAKWEKGITEPDTDCIKKMSLLFHVTTDYLMESQLNEKEPTPELVRNKLLKDLADKNIQLEDLDRLTPTQRELVTVMIQQLLNKK